MVIFSYHFIDWESGSLKGKAIQGVQIHSRQFHSGTQEFSPLLSESQHHVVLNTGQANTS